MLIYSRGLAPADVLDVPISRLIVLIELAGIYGREMKANGGA